MLRLSVFRIPVAVHWSFALIGILVMQVYDLPEVIGWVFGVLLAVLAHELGHVNARHSASKYSKAQLATITLGVGSIFSEEFAKYAQFASVGAQLMFLKFSRDDEREADKLGVGAGDAGVPELVAVGAQVAAARERAERGLDLLDAVGLEQPVDLRFGVSQRKRRIIDRTGVGFGRWAPVSGAHEVAGGDEQGRMRFGVEIAKRTRELCGPDFPIIFRLAGNSFVEGAGDSALAARFAAALEQAGDLAKAAVSEEGGLDRELAKALPLQTVLRPWFD